MLELGRREIGPYHPPVAGDTDRLGERFVLEAAEGTGELAGGDNRHGYFRRSGTEFQQYTQFAQFFKPSTSEPRGLECPRIATFRLYSHSLESPLSGTTDDPACDRHGRNAERRKR